jgi:tRNA nucleotidyltransferase/poly(A) polymerase
MSREPEIYRDHPLSTELIDPDAIKIVRRLRRFGFEAYLVGGCVRDLLLGIEPKDFDVATNATPREIRSTFRNCRIIGRRFRLCHIFFESKIIEVATFRTEPLAKLEEDAPERAFEVARELPPPPPPMAGAPRREAELLSLGGITDDEFREFAAGLIEVPPPQEVAASRAPGAAAAPAPEPCSPAPLPAHPPPPPSSEDLAPWESDEEAEVREELAIAGRRAVVREEVAAVAEEIEVAAREMDEEIVEGILEEVGEPRETVSAEPPADSPRADVEEVCRCGEPGRERRGRRRARWERLFDEDGSQAYGTAEEDARLRDFTINALFYDPVDERIIDYVGGMRDLESRLLRTIGEPQKRMIEDPVRILRAVKSAARLDLDIEPATFEAMRATRAALRECAPRRIVEEILKLLASGAAAGSFRMLAETGVLGVILPELEASFPVLEPAGGVRLSARPARRPLPFGYRVLEALDRTPKAALSPALLVAALFYTPVVEAWAREGLGRPGEEPAEPLSAEFRAETIADEMLREFASRHSLSRHTRAQATRAILAQRLLRKPPGRRMRAAKLVSRDWFDAALGLLEVAVEAEGADDEVVRSWVGRAAAVRAGEAEPVAAREEGGQGDFDKEGGAESPPKRRRRRRRGRRGRGGRSGGREGQSEPSRSGRAEGPAPEPFDLPEPPEP